MQVEIAPLGQADLDEANRIMNVAFGTRKLDDATSIGRDS